MKRYPTNLEVTMLDELRHVFLILRERMVTPKDYVEILGGLRLIIARAEKEVQDRHVGSIL